MAESFFIHFKNADWDALHKLLISAAYWFEDLKQWRYPAHVGGRDYRLQLYEYDNVVNEYEDDKIDQVIAAVGDWPASILCIQFRSGLKREDCDDAERLTLLLLEHFEGIADDDMGGLWTRAEIVAGVSKEHGKFLDCYRPISLSREQKNDFFETVK